MGALIWRPVALAAGGLAGLTLVWALAFHGPAQRRAGIEAERARALAALKQQIEERSRTNETVESLDDRGLCRALGGLFRDGRCD